MDNASSQRLAFSYNLPNALTLLRLGLAVVIAWLLFGRSQGGITAAGILLIIASLTDMLDGLAARRLGQSTLFGSLFDMTADQMLFMPSLILAVRAGLFDRADRFMPLNPYLYAGPALLGGVFVLTGIGMYMWKRRARQIEFPTPTKVAKYNFLFWLAPLIVAILGVGPGWLLAGLMYMSIISTAATFYSYLKKGSYVFTD
jgi:phosphatidylglycerophosphate synthase